MDEGWTIGTIERRCEVKGHWLNGALIKLPYNLSSLDTIYLYI
jgi:hypothetical protein